MRIDWKKIISAALVCGLLTASLPALTMAEEVPVETLKPAPTEAPTEKPTEAPTEAPTKAPTEAPTEKPTEAPTEGPTEVPTEEPTEAPMEEPTEAPAEEPTETPTEEPTEAPTEEPTETPTETPAEVPAMMSTTLTITEKLDLSEVSLTGYEDILVEAGGEIRGGSVNLPVVNHGLISGGTYHQEVINEGGAVIEGGIFEANVINRKNATIENGAFKLSVTNEGTIEDGSFIGYTPRNEEDPTPARTVQVENLGVIEGGEFNICKVRNDSDGQITGGHFADAVVLPDGSSVKLDFEKVHVKLAGSAQYFKPLEIFAMLDAEKNELVIMPLNPQEKLLGYSLVVTRGAQQFELTDDWNAAEDGYVHIPVAEEWLGGKALATVGYLSSADAQSAAATTEVTLPGVKIALSADVDYVHESVTLRTEEALPEGWQLVASPLPQQAVDYVAVMAADESSAAVTLDWPADSNEFSCPLKELGAEPESAGDAANYGVQLQLAHPEAGVGEALMLTLPARAAFSGKATGLKGVFKGAAEIELISAEGIETALALPGTQDAELKSGTLFADLLENTAYHIWVRDAAVPGEAFASKWKLAAATTTQAITEVSFSPAVVTASWQPTPGVPGITFDGGKLTAADLSYSWTDAQGNTGSGVPAKLGSYHLSCALSESKAKWYRLRETTLEYNVVPLEINEANTRVQCRDMAYTGKEQLPSDLTITVGGVEIPAEEFTVEKISGQNYTKTGTKRLKLSGKGNVTGSIEFTYSIYSTYDGSSWGGVSDVNENEVEGEESGVEEISYVSDNGERLRDDYLGVGEDPDQVLIVRDVLDEPMDYELLPVYNAREIGEDMENTLIVVAQPDEDGEILTRTLSLGLDQVKRLYEEGGFDTLLFRNGDGEGYLRTEELLTGDAAKLTMLMLVTQAEEIDLDSLNFDALVETQLADEQLAQVRLEIRVDPVILSDELNAWETTVWLCRDELRVDISALLPGFTIGMNVNGLFEEGEDDAFCSTYALALVNLDAQLEGEAAQVVQIRSALELIPRRMDADEVDSCEHFDVHMPTQQDPELLVDYTSETDIEPYRNYVMTAPYPGEGVYLVVSVEHNG